MLVLSLLGGAGMMNFGGFGMMGPGMMRGYSGMMSGSDNQFGFSFNPIGTIPSLVYWALIIGGIVLRVVWLARNANVSTIAQRDGLFTGSSELPRDILKARYQR